MKTHTFLSLRKDVMWGELFKLFKQSKADLGRAAAQRQFGGPVGAVVIGGLEEGRWFGIKTHQTVLEVWDWWKRRSFWQCCVFIYLGKGILPSCPEVRQGNLYDTPECTCHLQRNAEISQLGKSSVNFSIFIFGPWNDLFAACWRSFFHRS